jgi:hypothetical protein
VPAPGHWTEPDFEDHGLAPTTLFHDNGGLGAALKLIWVIVAETPWAVAEGKETPSERLE